MFDRRAEAGSVPVVLTNVLNIINKQMFVLLMLVSMALIGAFTHNTGKSSAWSRLRMSTINIPCKNAYLHLKDIKSMTN